MITYANPMGSVSLTSGCFAELVGQAARGCYGVADLSPAPTAENLKSIVMHGGLAEKGVKVTQKNSSLCIELHIKVGYGVNISTIVHSITHRVKHEVEYATGLKVARIDVSVDDIVTE